MRLTLTSFIGLALLGVSLACSAASPVKTTSADTTGATTQNSPATPAVSSEPDDNAPRITLADAKKAFDNGEAIFIDTRGADFYNLEHIKGAINITMDSVDARYKEIPQGKKIIAYCS